MQVTSVPFLGWEEALDKGWAPTPVFLGFPGGSISKESTHNVGDLDSIPGLGRSPGGGDDNPLQYSCLGNPMDRGAWGATVHGVAKSRTPLSDRHNTCWRWCCHGKPGFLGPIGAMWGLQKVQPEAIHSFIDFLKKMQSIHFLLCGKHFAISY